MKRYGKSNIFIINESEETPYQNNGRIPAEQINVKNAIKLEGKLFDVSDLSTQKVWLVGSKLPSDETFHLHLVYSLKHKQRLWDHFSKNGIHFFFTEIEVPYRLNDKTAPF